MSNVASRTYKKRGFCSCGAQFAPPIAFEMHRWHLPLRLGVTTGKTTTSDPKAFPKRLAPGRGNSMAWRAQGHRFSTCVGMIFSVKRCVQNLLKKRIIQLGLNWHFQLPSTGTACVCSMLFVLANRLWARSPW